MEDSEVMNGDTTPLTLDKVIADIQGFGIEEFSEILTIQSAGRTVQLRMANVSTEHDLMGMLAAQDYKGYSWVQRIKCEVLSRSIVWINGIDLRNLQGEARFVLDPVDRTKKDVQVVLRDTLLRWGVEMVGVLWKILMKHAQDIEDNLTNQFPDNAILTQVEQRILDMVREEIEESNKSIIQDTIDETIKEADKITE